ncbi:MAG: cellulase family glycosylhydrolase [Ruminococcus sp.]|nr:cellulase family glycosylhydrolase [Ruminococcus sp.]
MGFVIIALIAALLITNLGGDDKVKTDNGDGSDVSYADATTDDEDSSDSKKSGSDSSKASSDSKKESSGSEDSKSDDDSSSDDASSDNDNGSSASDTSSGSSDTSSKQSGDSSKSSDTSSKSSDSSSSSGSETASGETVVTWSGNNTWENAGVTMTGMEVGVKNGGSTVISNWKLELDISGVKNCDGWNGTYTVGSGKLTITPADYNKDIQPGGNINLGANIGTTGALNITGAKLNGKTVKLVKGKVAQENNQASQGGNNGNNGGNGGNNNGGGNNGSQQVPSSEEVKKLIAAPASAAKGDDWLHTSGNKILDASGKQVWLTGLNWFGYNTGTNTFDGLWNSKLEPTVKAIADHGFNLVRVPMSAELLLQWKKGEYPKANYNNAYNPTLNGMNSQEIFDYFLRLCADNGIKVMPDIHSAETDAQGHNVNLWFTAKISANDYFSALEYLADRYKNNDTIIAIDLKNEPHGKPNEGASAAIWNDSKSANNWKHVAETAALKVLAKNPNVLIMVEGTEIYSKKNGSYTSSDSGDYYFNWWGGNLRGVKDYPLDLGKYQNKLVYSPHDYGPTVYEQPWFKGNYSYDSLMKDCWKDNWLYIHTGNTAPLLIGEWGGFMTQPNLKWMTYMRQLIKTYHLNHTFWCLNANSGDTGGLLLDNFTDWDTEKYNFVKEVLWQEGGKFVGLDHQVALGANGITLTKAKGL